MTIHVRAGAVLGRSSGCSGGGVLSTGGGVAKPEENLRGQKETVLLHYMKSELRNIQDQCAFEDIFREWKKAALAIAILF